MNQQYGLIVNIARMSGLAGDNLIEFLEPVSAKRLLLNVYPFGVILPPSVFFHVIRQSYYSAVQIGTIKFNAEPAAGKIILDTLPFPNKRGFFENTERVEDLSNHAHLVLNPIVVA
jgi:hypothetical protein